MGAQLVARTYTSWAHLADRPFRLLAHMALVCMDDDTEPVYWGGRGAMCDALGLEAGLDSSHTMVKRALRVLTDAGAVKRTRQGHNGRRSEYALLIHNGPARFPQEGRRGYSDDPLRGYSDDPLRGYSDDPLRGYSDDPLRGYSDDPPRNNRGNNRGLPEEQLSSSKVRVTRGRAHLAPVVDNLA